MKVCNAAFHKQFKYSLSLTNLRTSDISLEFKSDCIENKRQILEHLKIKPRKSFKYIIKK